MKTTYCIKAVLFDFDGTLTQPGAIDFNSIKTALGCPLDMPVLEFIEGMTTDQDRETAMEALQQFESKAALRSHPNDGAQQIIVWIKGQQLPMGIITRNSRYSVMTSLENFTSLGVEDFRVIITRDDHLAPKPSGDGIIWAAKQFDVEPGEVLIVGDYIFDIQAGQAAGALTALLDSGEDAKFKEAACDFRIKHLSQLQSIIQAGRETL